MLKRRSAVGFRAHSGWAAMVAVGGTAAAPVVMLRRRIELVKPGIPVQPYHAAAEMELQDAERFVRHCAGVARTMALAALRDVLAELAKQDVHIIGCAVLMSAGRPTGDLAATLASHTAIHTAEGEFFREALRRAGEACDLPVAGFRERDLWGQAATGLGLTEQELQRRVADLGKSIGPPWTQDQKLAALAAWLVLAGT